MDALDYIEDQARRNVTFRIETRELLHKRATSLCTILLGGGGAVAAWALARLESGLAPGPIALLAVSAWALIVGGWVVMRCLPTAEVLPPSNEPKILLSYFEKKHQGETTVDEALVATRKAELEALQDRIQGYAICNTQTAQGLDRAYKAAALTPIIGLAAWALAAYLVG